MIRLGRVRRTWASAGIVALLLLAGACAGEDESPDAEPEQAGTTGGPDDPCADTPAPAAGVDLTRHEIAFVRSEDDVLDLWVVTAAGEDPVRLTDDPLAEWTPAWSPEGDRIAFACATDPEAPSDLYVMDADGSDRARLTQTPAECESSPSWTPDGERLFYAVGACGAETGVWVIGSDGGDPREVLERGDWPALSPDGERLVYNLPRGDRSFLEASLWVSNADGSGAIELGPAGAPGASEGTWSPDGTRIAFVVPDGRLDAEVPSDWDENVYVMNADGSEPSRLTTTPGNDHWPPAWSPDGRRVIFSSDGTGDAMADLVVVDVATGERHLFRMDGSHELFPTWRG